MQVFCANSFADTFLSKGYFSWWCLTMVKNSVWSKRDINASAFTFANEPKSFLK